MAKVSWDDLTPVANADGTPITAPPKKKVSWDDLTPIDVPAQHGKLYSFLGGLLNPTLNSINWALSGLKGATMPGLMGGQSALLHQAGTPTAQPNVAPQLPTLTGAHGMPYLIGELAGFGVPFSGASKLLGGASKLAPIESMLQGVKPGLQSLGKTMGAAAGAGYTSADTGASRKSAALTSALGGMLGEGAARLLGKGFEKLPSILPREAPPIEEAPPTPVETEFENTLGKINQEKRPTSTQASQDLLNSLVRKYSEARQSVRPLYNAVFGSGAGGEIETMEPKDLISYKNFRGGLPDYRQAKFIAPHKLITPDMKAIKPEDVHFYKSNLLKLARKYKGDNNELSSKYNEGAEALDYDLGNFLRKQGLLEDYDNAQAQWAKRVVPYTSDKNFAPILEHLDKNKLSKFENAKNIQDAKESGIDEDIIDTSNPNFLKKTAPVAKLTNRFLPTHSEYDPGSMEKLGQLLKDKNLAASHLKNIMYAKHQKTNGFDLNSFLKEMYSKVGQGGKSLSPEQRNFMFSPNEQSYWDRLDNLNTQYKDVMKAKKGEKPITPEAIPSQIPSSQTGATIAGSMVGHHLGIPGGTIIGGLAGSQLSKIVDKLAPDFLQKVAAKNLKVSPRAAKRAAYIGSALGSAPFQ